MTRRWTAIQVFLNWGDNMHTFLVALSASLMLGQAHARCSYTVTGRITVDDQLFSTSATTRNVVGATVVIDASRGTKHPFARWGTARTNAKGYFRLNKTIRTFCRQKRRFKVSLKFSNDKVKLETPAFQPRVQPIMQTSMKGTRKGSKWSVSLGRIHLPYAGYTTEPGRQRHFANRLALLWYAYQIQYDTFKRWGLKPKTIRTIYPNGPGETGWADFFSGRSRLNRKWFTHSKRWSRTEALHEPVHIWWNQHLFLPWFLTGRVGNTHELKESPPLALYEAFAEWVANVLNRDIFRVSLYTDLERNTRHEIYQIFRDAVHFKPNGKRGRKKVWPDTNKLRRLFKAPTSTFRKAFWSSEHVVMNYLNILTTSRWYRKAYGTMDESSVPNEFSATPCPGVPEQLFTPDELMRALLDWHATKRTKVGQRGMDSFMRYLRDTRHGFRPYYKLVLDLGNPGKTVAPKAACVTLKHKRD
ncbi:MAG: hypothetical protein VX589_05025 [Myxococcota bacterium]|nr:hypothetical protein [Myxococcota bacterium]